MSIKPSLTQFILQRRDEIIERFSHLKKAVVTREDEFSTLRAESYNNAVEDCIRVLKDLL